VFSPANLGGLKKNENLKHVEIKPVIKSETLTSPEASVKALSENERVEIKSVVKSEALTLTEVLIKAPPKVERLVDVICFACDKVFQNKKGLATQDWCSDECKIERRKIISQLAHKARQERKRILAASLSDLKCAYCNGQLFTIVDKFFCSVRCSQLWKADNSNQAKVKTSDQESDLSKGLTAPIEILEAHISQTYLPSKEKKFTPRTTTVDERKVREHAAKRDEFDFRCPNPGKKTYRTMEEAYNFIDFAHPEDNFIRPYTCRCGAIHIGHGTPRKTS